MFVLVRNVAVVNARFGSMWKIPIFTLAIMRSLFIIDTITGRQHFTPFSHAHLLLRTPAHAKLVGSGAVLRWIVAASWLARNMWVLTFDAM
jgi:hypothetical protein